MVYDILCNQGFIDIYTYDPTFYEYVNRGSTRSAEVMVPLIARYLNVKSVVDFGCGQGAWLLPWKRLGVVDLLGLDGQYVARNALLISQDEFRPCDLSKPINLSRSFDLVQSLEVAEHLPEQSADIFINNLVCHGKIVLFSAAAIGQGGENHVNEQPYHYWRDKFLKRGYIMFDAIRPLVTGNRNVEPWYRYNTFLFVERASVDMLPADLFRYRLDGSTPIPDVSPLWYKMRKFFIRLLPISVRTWLSIANRRMTARRHSR